MYITYYKYSVLRLPNLCDVTFLPMLILLSSLFRIVIKLIPGHFEISIQEKSKPNIKQHVIALQ